MAISDVDNVLLLVQRTGDVDPVSADPISPLTQSTNNGIVMINADRIWNKYIIYKAIQPAVLGSEIFDHYFMITAEQLITAILASRISFSAVGTAVRVDLSDRWEHHKAVMDDLREELDKLFVRASAYAVPVMAPILAIVPQPPPVPGQLPSPSGNIFTPDANSPIYYGSPYWSEWRRW